MRGVAPFLCLVFVGCAFGCGSDPRARYVPAETAAQSALEEALKGWKRGEPAGFVEGPSSPRVHVVDSLRNTHPRLQDYAILGPAPGDGPRVFAVRLTLPGPSKERNARYVVLGIDPLWVMRYEDYEMLAHWDHPMDAEPAKNTKR